MPPDPLNEVTFVAHLGTVTSLRAAERRRDELPVLIAAGEVEERQVDPATGRYLRCDIRLNSPTGVKLASGEMKRPEVPEGRDPLAEGLRADARRKAVARGLPYYFTCNMATVVLWSVAARPGDVDHEEGEFALAPIRHSREVEANYPLIERNWVAFLDALEEKLRATQSARPSVTTEDVIRLRDAIDAIAEEAIERVVRAVTEDDVLAETTRAEASAAFGFTVALAARFAGEFRRELRQILRLGTFVLAQKLVLYRVLGEVGPRRVEPFSLDEIPSVGGTTDPLSVLDTLRSATAHAIRQSKDYETAFNPQPLQDILFVRPGTDDERVGCRVGAAWQALIDTVASVSWAAISQNLVGFLYEAIVDPEYRHDLGQHYTREDVVDVLVTYAIREPADVVMDPASGGGSFLRSAYERKRQLGATHEQALEQVWGFEITAFAAELATITLATADTYEAAAYPRVLLRDFFSTSPGQRTELQIPGEAECLAVPEMFDAVVGNPPYISYRRQRNQEVIAQALTRLPEDIVLPIFSGKSDEYVYFMAHATAFLKTGGRFAFIVSSAILFSDYGIQLVRFLARHYRIDAVIDSMVERWFVEADTNTVLLLLARETDEQARRTNLMRFIRLRRPLSTLLAPPVSEQRRGSLEDFLDELLRVETGGDDPRFMVNLVLQGEDGGLEMSVDASADAALPAEDFAQAADESRSKADYG